MVLWKVLGKHSWWGVGGCFWISNSLCRVSTKKVAYKISSLFTNINIVNLTNNLLRFFILLSIFILIDMLELGISIVRDRKHAGYDPLPEKLLDTLEPDLNESETG